MDDLYMENLEEYVLDEGQVISYKILACKLQVNVNLAKQMLYNFVTTPHSKKVHAIYYISGRAPTPYVQSLGKHRTKQAHLEAFTDYAADQFLVALCKDTQLERVKKEFSELFSVHVYAVSSYEVEIEELERVMSQKVHDDEGRAPVKYGLITSKAGKEIRRNPRLERELELVAQVKETFAIMKKKEEEEKLFKKPVEKPLGKKEAGKERLMGLFANAKKKEEVKKTKVEEEVKKMKVEQVKKPKAEEAPLKKTKVEEAPTKKAPAKKSFKKRAPAKSDDRKRKRIKDVFSSSDEEEEEEKKFSDDDDFLPESPVPRRSRVAVESDPEEEPEPAPEPEKQGKRKVYKSVAKRHVDDDGFMVTVMEQQLVYEDDEKEKVPQPPPPAPPAKVDKKPPAPAPAPSPAKPKGKKQPPKVDKKQASITSFFTKKV